MNLNATRSIIKERGMYLFFPIPLLILASCGSSSSSNDINYVAIGASDAAGIGATPIGNGYVYRIKDSLNEQCGSIDLNNLGVPGLTANEIEDIEIPVAVRLNPDLVTVFTGGNDLVSGRSIEDFESDLADILTKLRSDTGAAIFVANLPDMTQLPEFQQDPDRDVTAERVAAFNAAISRQVGAAGATEVDLFSHEVNSTFVASDGFHPNDAGHQLMADLFLAKIVPQICSGT